MNDNRTHGNLARRIWMSAAAATLTLGTTLALAQNYGPPQGPPPQGQWDDAHWGNGPQGYNDFYHENGQPNFAARRGYGAGYNMGVSDRSNGHSYRPTHLDEYKHIPDPPHGMSSDEFKHIYRDSFIRGYQRGYGR